MIWSSLIKRLTSCAAKNNGCRLPLRFLAFSLLTVLDRKLSAGECDRAAPATNIALLIS